MHITTDMLIDLYHTRSQQLQDARTQMRNYRRGLKHALKEKDSETFARLRHQAEVAAKQKHMIEDSFLIVEKELSDRFSECKETN